MAGQVWVVVALCSIMGVVPCLAAAEAQIVYNPDGTTKLEIINVPGQSPQGRMSWQTPDLSQVWIQYPVNQQGRIPWTPPAFTYSVVSDPGQRVVPVVSSFQPVAVQSNPQVFSFDERTQEQSPRFDSGRRFESRVPVLTQSLPNEVEYDYDYDYIDEAISDNQPIAGSSDGVNIEPIMDKFPGPEVDERVLPEMDKFPGPVMDKFPGPGMDKFPGPVMDKFPGPVMDKFPGPEIHDVALPEMDKFPGPEVDDIPDTTIGTFAIPTTERPIQTTSERNRFTLPFTTTTSRSVHFTEARVTPLPTRFRPTTQTRPMMNKFPGTEESRVTPIPRRFRPTTERTLINIFSGSEDSRVTSPTERTVMNKFPGPMVNKFPGPTESPVEVFTGQPLVDDYTNEDEIIPVTDPIFQDIVVNELDSSNIVEPDEQVEETTELGPVVRLTSRGRPRIFNNPAQKTRFETRKQSSPQKPNQSTRQNQNRRPVPQLIVDPSLRENNIVQSNPPRFRRPGTINAQRRTENDQFDQSQLIPDPSFTENNTEQPSRRVNNENRRRPGLRRLRPRNRVRPGIRRIPVAENDLPIPSVDITLPREEVARSLPIERTQEQSSRPDSGRGAARSPPRRFRFRYQRPSPQ